MSRLLTVGSEGVLDTQQNKQSEFLNSKIRFNAGRFTLRRSNRYLNIGSLCMGRRRSEMGYREASDAKDRDGKVVES